MCEYCEKGLINREMEIFWFAIRPKTNRLLLIFDNCGYQTQREVEIKYCPMCGRELESED